MRVVEVLRSKGTNIVSIAPASTLHVAAVLLKENRIGALLVIDDRSTICGILSERDIVSSIARDGAQALAMSVESAMSANVVTCNATDTLEQLMTVMSEHRIRHLPVVENGELIGIISIGDVVKRRISEVSDEARALTEYITMGR
jgi:CBS domain-containing protein